MSGLDLRRARVALRDRTPSEVFDLSTRFLVVQRRSYAKVAVVGLVPPLLVAVVAHAVLPGALTWLVAVPLALASEIPFTILASRLVFQDEVRARDVLKAALREAPRVFMARVLTLGLTALGLAALLVPGVWLATILSFVTESMLLEQAGLLQALGRSQRLASASLADMLLSRLILTLVPIASVLLFDIAGRIVLSELLQFTSPEPVWAYGASVLGTIGLFLQVPYFATARFLLYLDVRTKTEGWDIQTKFNAIAARMETEKSDARRAA